MAICHAAQIAVPGNILNSFPFTRWNECGLYEPSPKPDEAGVGDLEPT
jgi:hypothetical protein